MTVNLIEFTAADDRYGEAEDHAPPSYKTPGWMIVNVMEPSGTVYRWDAEVLDYDNDSCVFWISEGEGFDYWIDQRPDIEAPGVYYLGGIVGDYVRGDGYSTDDNVYWEVGEIRPATPEELARIPDA